MSEYNPFGSLPKIVQITALGTVTIQFPYRTNVQGKPAAVRLTYGDTYEFDADDLDELDDTFSNLINSGLVAFQIIGYNLPASQISYFDGSEDIPVQTALDELFEEVINIGGLAQVIFTGDGSATPNQQVILVDSDLPVTVTLPLLSSVITEVSGVYYVKPFYVFNKGTGTVTAMAAGSDTINDASTAPLTFHNGSITLIPSTLGWGVV